MQFNPRWIKGKTVARVVMNPWRDETRGTTNHSPHIWFTDGSHIWFTTEEGEFDYGVSISYAKPRKGE